jgi:protein O-mannosyl-transferase
VAVSLSKRAPDLRLICVLTGLLVFATLLAYSSVWRFDFNNYDDLLYVTGNDLVKQGLTWNGVVTVFTRPVAANWHPLTMISHMLDVQLFGLNSGAHHLVNLLFHIFNSVLVLWIFFRMTGAAWPSAALALLFAVHPLHVESVAWVAQRKDVLSGFFGLLAIGAYVGYARRGTAARYLAVVLFFGIGLLCKPILMTVPILLLLLDYWPLARFRCCSEARPDFAQHPPTRLVMEKLPLALLSLLCGLMTVWAQSRFGAVGSLERFSLGERIGNAVVSYARYTGKTIWPSDLSFLYPHPGAWPWPMLVAALLFLAVVSMVTVIFARQRPYLMVGWLWFVIALAPVIGLVQAGEQAMADRYMYLPLLGLGVMLCWGIRDLAAPRPDLRKAMPWVTVLVFTALTLVARLQARHWRTSESLYAHALKLDWNNATAHQLLARTLSERGDNFSAVKHYSEALARRPNYDVLHYNLGIVFTDLEAPVQATNHLSQALSLNPTNIGARFHLGRALAMLGDNQGAASNYSVVLAALPHDRETRIQLAHAYLGENKIEAALRLFEEAVRQAPASAAAHHGYGVGLLKAGKTQQAITHLRQALTLAPGSAVGHRHLGQALQSEGSTAEAIAAFREAIRLRPDFAEALNDLAWILATHPDAQVRDAAQAVKLATRACELSGYQQPVPLATLAAARAENGQFDEAIIVAERGLSLAQAGDKSQTQQRIEQILRQARNRKPYRTGQ